ncbi:hypothetical protein P4O66_018973, partial [Electrophorus voltai]
MSSDSLGCLRTLSQAGGSIHLKTVEGTAWETEYYHELDVRLPSPGQWPSGEGKPGIGQVPSSLLPVTSRDLEYMPSMGRICTKLYTTSESISDYGNRISEDDEDDDDDDVMALFHIDSFPVKCFTERGTLHKKRFATGSYKFYAKLLDSEELKDSPQSEENTAKKQRRRNKRKKSVEETEDDEQPSPSSSSSPNQQKSPKKPKFSSSEEMEESVEQREEREEEDEEEGEAVDLSEFQAPSLPVSCGSVSGVLFKSRFASGTRGKSIRTEERWFTPEEFVKQELTLTDGCWKRDIKCHSKTLSDLLQKILKVHSLLCKCDLCSPTEQELLDQDNDDECFICNSHGDLLCCDECPRAFHCHCHIPALHNNTLGDKWMCTYCVLKNNQHWLRHGTMTEEQALDCPVSQYILFVRAGFYVALLTVSICCCVCIKRTHSVCLVKTPAQWHGNLEMVVYMVVFTGFMLWVSIALAQVRRYRDFISEPMWLDRVKDKLHSQKYETLRHFVSDISLIFQNCTTVNR